MSDLTHYAERLLADWMLTGDSVTRPSDIYLALFTSATDKDGGGDEVSGNGYSRQPVSMSSADTSGGETTSENTSSVQFTADGGDWGTITHVALFDSSNGGNMLAQSPMAENRTINDADTLNFATGDVVFSLE